MALKSFHHGIFGWPYPNVPMPPQPQAFEPGKPAPQPIPIPKGWWPYPPSVGASSWMGILADKGLGFPGFVPVPELKGFPSDVRDAPVAATYAKQNTIPFAHDFQNNMLVHAQSFTLPVISMVLITILNDGCMITISHDRVQPEKKPQKWRLFEATVVAIVLGMVACISTIFLLVGLLHNNLAQGGADVSKFIASNGRNYVTWFEIRTIIYLKVSVSDFLTLFSARTRTWFWERSVGGPLLIAACVALFASTMFALFWSTLPSLNAGSYMAGLKDSQGAAFCTWIYCILWWLVQDAAKVYTYFLLDLQEGLKEAKRDCSFMATFWAQFEVMSGHDPRQKAHSFKNPLPGADSNGGKKSVQSADW